MRDHVVNGIAAIEKIKIPAYMLRTVGEHYERLYGSVCDTAKLHYSDAKSTQECHLSSG